MGNVGWEIKPIGLLILLTLVTLALYFWYRKSPKENKEFNVTNVALNVGN